MFIPEHNSNHPLSSADIICGGRAYVTGYLIVTRRNEPSLSFVEVDRSVG